MNEMMKKITVACGFFILFVIILVSCLEKDSSSDDYKSYGYDDNGITQQDRDNIEFYKEMEDAWNKKYNLE